MLTIKVNKRDERRVQRRFSKMSRRIEKSGKRDVPKAMAKPVFDMSQQLVKVDTGRLKRSGNLAVGGEKAFVEYTAEYAAIQEYGNNPFLRPAVKRAKREISKAAEVEFKKSIT